MEDAVRRPLVADAVFSRLMDGLTGGTFLAGLALLTGADNLRIALIASLPFLAQVIQLPALALLLRLEDRRQVVVWTAGGARLLLLGIAVLLFVSPGHLTPPVLLGILAAAAVLTVVATAAWNWWMRDLLPTSELGTFFGQRLRGATLAGLVVMLAAGTILDAYDAAGRAATGYAILFAAGGAAGLLGVVALRMTPTVRAPPSPSAKRSLRQAWQAVRAAPRGLLPALSLTTVTASFALPFSAVFLLRGVGYGYLAVTVLAVLSQVAYLAGLRGWAHVSDRHGDRSVLSFSVSVLALAFVGWTLAGWSAGPALLAWFVMLHFLAGYAMGGIDLAGTNLLLRSAPASNGAAHLAGVSVLRAAAGGLGVLVAGVAWQVMGPGTLAQVQLPLLGVWRLHGFQVLCAVSVVLAAACALAVARMPAPHGHGTVEVARALRKEVHQMSSIAGMRGLIHAVSYYVEFMAVPFVARRKPTKADKAAKDTKGDHEGHGILGDAGRP